MYLESSNNNGVRRLVNLQSSDNCECCVAVCKGKCWVFGGFKYGSGSTFKHDSRAVTGFRKAEGILPPRIFCK